ncbi:outer membrane protein assembly factor BamE [Alphaproteobacteria bacterium GH1-50]|uniref:Outer membrane protein assembly factor BamE n=1 Tax=Kangsaoukella pontilimi TaxID=2691042 RepID=A0A7C9IN38_9RHOB|nr:outer membrane protein assembly factor BamE [Kangsaoukella pontilimi]MXQ07090.1 outer membrane protein assembly factor BamE [Kangsaoukella pontilimi]
MTKSSGTGLKAAAAGTALLFLASCATLEDRHGYIPEQSSLDTIVVGRDTQDTVALLIGRPGTTGVIQDTGWYYVRSDYERFLWREPVEVDREVVAISFTGSGVVSNIERFGLEDGRIVALNRRVTDSNIEGVSFLRQLFSNFGNLSAGDILDEN